MGKYYDPLLGRWIRIATYSPPISEETMTTPTPTTSAKAVVAGIGSILMVLVPILQSVAGVLPPPWGAIVTGFIALLTVLGVYRVENKPKV